MSYLLTFCAGLLLREIVRAGIYMAAVRKIQTEAMSEEWAKERLMAQRDRP